MRIDYLTSVRLDEPGAPTNHVLGGCQGFLAHGHEVCLIHPLPRLSPRNEVVVERSGSLQEITCWWPGIRGGWRLFERAVGWKVLRRFRGANVPDLLYLRFSPSAVLARMLRRIRAPKVFELNGLAIAGQQAFGAVMQEVDLILVDREPMRERFARLCPQYARKTRSHLIAATDCRQFRPLDKSHSRRDLAIPQQSRVMVHASGFLPHHDFDTMLASLRQLRAADSRYRLFLLGSGPRWNEVRAKADELVQADAVRMPGAIELSRLPWYLNAADVCVNSLRQFSAAEGNQRAFKIYEYMACERPVIDSIDPRLPVPDWARQYLGLVPAESVDDLSAMVRQIIDNPELWAQRAKDSRRYVLENCSWPAVVKTTLERIDELIAGRKAPV